MPVTPPDALRLLLWLLAETDAALAPVRCWEGAVARNVHAARADLAAAGLRCRLEGSAEVKLAALAGFEELAVLGLVAAVQQPSDPSLVRARLTPRGDDLAREALGYTPSLCMLALAARHSDRSPRTLGRRWVSEEKLADPDAPGLVLSPAQKRALDLFALPCLSRGLLESASTVRGRAAYAVTPDGWRALDAGETAVRPTGLLPAADDLGALDPHGVYAAKLLAARRRLAADAPVGGVQTPALRPLADGWETLPA